MIYEELKQFKIEKGHCEVPIKYNDNQSFGMWVSTLRQQYKLIKEGKQSPLCVDRIEALVAIWFTWKIKKQSSPVPWIVRYEELKQFKIKKGHCEVPSKYIANPSLGTWVSTLRHQYKLIKEGKPSPLSADKIEALEAIGFTWQMKKQSNPAPHEVHSSSSPSPPTRTKKCIDFLQYYK